MTRRPMLILNGKATRYFQLIVKLWNSNFPGEYFPMANIDGTLYNNVKVSQSTRPSGRRVIWVHTEVEDGMAI